MISIPKILLPTIIRISVYGIIDKFLPEEVRVSQKDALKDMIGSNRIELTKAIFKKLLNKE